MRVYVTAPVSIVRLRQRPNDRGSRTIHKHELRQCLSRVYLECQESPSADADCWTVELIGEVRVLRSDLNIPESICDSVRCGEPEVRCRNSGTRTRANLEISNGELFTGCLYPACGATGSNRVIDSMQRDRSGTALSLLTETQRHRRWLGCNFGCRSFGCCRGLRSRHRCLN